MKNHKLPKLIPIILSIALVWQGLVWAQPDVIHSLRGLARAERKTELIAQIILEAYPFSSEV